MAVKIDIKKSSTWLRDKSGDRATRVAIISGVTGNADALLKNALDDASMPNYGDAHPQDASITLQRIQVAPLGGGRYRALMEYYADTTTATTAATSSLSASGNTVTEESKFDAYGNPIVTYYNKITDKEASASAAIDRPRTTFNFSYLSDSYPRAEIDAYQGKVNSLAWNGYAPKTVLCSSVDADAKGDKFQVRFSFVYDPETWVFEQRVYASLPLVAHTTLPDGELDLTTGKRLWDLAEAIDFTPLGLSIGGIYAVMSGTILSSTTEANIVAGGKTIILDLTGDTWVAAGATFDAVRQDILDGLIGGTLPTGINAVDWNSLAIPVTNVVRTDNDTVTITLTAQATYSITRSETVKCTIPASALVTSSHPLVVSQRFKIQAA